MLENLQYFDFFKSELSKNHWGILLKREELYCPVQFQVTLGQDMFANGR